MTRHCFLYVSSTGESRAVPMRGQNVNRSEDQTMNERTVRRELEREVSELKEKIDELKEAGAFAENERPGHEDLEIATHGVIDDPPPEDSGDGEDDARNRSTNGDELEIATQGVTDDGRDGSVFD